MHALRDVIICLYSTSITDPQSVFVQVVVAKIITKLAIVTC